MQAKYAEYIFGYEADKAYNMTSYNANDGFVVYTQNGTTKIKNPIIKHSEPQTYYYVGTNPSDADSWGKAIEPVTKEEFDAYQGNIKKTYNVTYQSYSTSTGDSMTNRYEYIGPNDDMRAAVFGIKHFRTNDKRNGAIETPSMIHFDTDSTFTASENNITLEFDMLDVGTNKIVLKYCAKDGTVKSQESPAFTNTGKWITVKFTLTDADFAWTKDTGLGDQKQDFRLEADKETYVSAVRVYDAEKRELAEGDYTTIKLADYDVAVNKDGTVYGNVDLTAQEAEDATVYVAVYDKFGDFVEVIVSDKITDGVAQKVMTSDTKTVFNHADYIIKRFVWNSSLRPLR